MNDNKTMSSQVGGSLIASLDMHVYSRFASPLKVSQFKDSFFPYFVTYSRTAIFF